MPDETDPERVVGALDHLLARFPDPRTADRETFLRARYDAGLGWVHFEPGFGGLGVAASWQQAVEDRLGPLGAPAPGSGDFVGMHQAAASINAVGTHEQKARFLPAIFTGAELWCQLFSEPGAGSDLAGLSTMAVRDGDEWVVHGQKVWTSGARAARWAILVARTDPDVPKHRGLTFFVCDMRLAGIEIRPLRQADGAAHFNEVFLDGVRLPDDLRLGDPGQGWAVSLVGLHSEREGVGEVMQTPIDDVLTEWSRLRVPSAIADVQRQRVAGAWIEARLLELSNERSRAAQGRAGATPLGSLQKVASAAANQRTSSLLVDLMGPAGQVGFDYDAEQRDDGAVADPSPSMQVVRSRANSIEGGTDEIQRNIIGEQLLGLPGDVRVDKAVPWKEVPRS
jgi:alkylation response protein AidB-like acyl-CoA dehydrogenase